MSRGPLVVVGDVLLDVDVDGTVSRTAPDAPAPVVDVERRVERPGGAGLAAWLAASDRACDREVVLVTALGDDDEARAVRGLLAGRVRVVALPTTSATTVKTRVRAHGQTLLRLDRSGEPGPAGFGDVPEEAREALAAAAAVLVSDYGRGVTAHAGVRGLLAHAARHAPLVWDPHTRGTAPVSGTLVATPNDTEVRALTGERATDLAGLTRAAAGLLARWRVRALAVTRGEAGALLSYGEGVPVHLPAPVVPGRPEDTCGAGDRFSASVALALAGGAVVREAVGTAVVAAADFVRDGAAARCLDDVEAPPLGEPADGVELAGRVRAGGGTVVATGGCFDLLHRGHVETLQAARRLGDCLVVCLNSDASVRRLKGPERPLVAQEDRARVLLALDCVDAVVVFDDDTPERVLGALRPHVWCKGGDYAGEALPEEQVLRTWGGQAVVLPYLAGHSTTRLTRSTTGANP